MDPILPGMYLVSPMGIRFRLPSSIVIFETDSNGVLDREEVHNLLRTVGLRSVHIIENLFDPYPDKSDIGMTGRLEAVHHDDAT